VEGIIAMSTKKQKQPTSIQRELTIEDAVSEAFGEIQSLAEEMREAYDNTPEALQNSGVGEARGEAADNLENISEPEVPTELQGDKFKVTWQVPVLSPSKQRKRSRSNRRYDAIETLNQVVARLEELKEDEEQSEEVREAAESFVDDVQTVIDEAESVEFPGMYG
jgi:hypothetical protein